MQDQRTTLARRAAVPVALFAGGAVITQAGLNIGAALAKGTSPFLAILVMYGFFTIWSNTLVALIAARYAWKGSDGSLLTRPGAMAAATVYIIVVGAIYNVLLAKYNPVTGVRLATDTVLHSIVPITYSLWWLVLVPRRRLAWAALGPALLFPTAYCVVALARGALTGKYAYFFIDIDKYGLAQVLLNIGLLVLFFAGLMAAIIFFDRWAHGRSQPPVRVG